MNGQTPTPGVLHDFLKSNGGYQGNLYVWGAVSRYGLSYQDQHTIQTTIKAGICASKIVILNVNRGGNLVLATGYTDNTYSVMDPGYDKFTYPADQVVRAAIYNLN